MPLDGALSPSTTLLRIADHLETVPDDKFDISIWWNKNGHGCAIGHAIDAGILNIDLCNHPAIPDVYVLSKYDNYGYLASMLGIEEKDIIYMFGFCSILGNSKEDVIEKMRQKAHELAMV